MPPTRKRPAAEPSRAKKPAATKSRKPTKKQEASTRQRANVTPPPLPLPDSPGNQETFDIRLLPAVVWVRTEEGGDAYGWWPGKIVSDIEVIPLQVERFGDTEPSTLALFHPGPTTLLHFRHSRFAELRTAGSSSSFAAPFEAAMSLALDAEMEDDDGLPSLERVILTPMKAKKKKEIKQGGKTAMGKKAKAKGKGKGKGKVSQEVEKGKDEDEDDDEEVRQEVEIDPFASSAPARINETRKDDDGPMIESKDDSLEIPGELVFAYYSEDKKYYPAKVLDYISANGKYKVLYFDGRQRSLTRKWFYTMLEKGFAACKVGETTSYVPNPNYDDPDLRVRVLGFVPALRRVLSGQDSHAWRLAEFRQGGKARRVLAQSVGQGPLDNDEFRFVWQVLRETFVPEVKEERVRRRGRGEMGGERMGVDSGSVGTSGNSEGEYWDSLSPTMRLSVVNDVLLPETIIRLIMDEENVSDYDEAERRMLEGYRDRDDRWVERIWTTRSAFAQGEKSLREKRLMQ